MYMYRYIVFFIVFGVRTPDLIHFVYIVILKRTIIKLLDILFNLKILGETILLNEDYIYLVVGYIYLVY